jgi:broad specificity phosphatase PhoE
MAKDWPVIISGLNSLLSRVGPIWPDSTKLSGFASDGPYHCANCEYLNKDRNRCNQEVMKADPEVQHDEKGLAIITDPERQCCEFVEPVKAKQTQPQGDQLVALFIRHGETGMNKENRFRGQMEIPLNNNGRQQALDVRRFLVGKQLGAAFRSSKDRTRETADLVLGPNKAKEVKNFDALNVGKFSGEKKTDENIKEIKHYQEYPDQKIPGGERINDFRARTNPEIKMAIEEGEKTGKPSVSFVHSSTIHQVSHLLHNDHNAVKVRPGGIVGVYRRSNGSLYARALLHESTSKQDQQMMS